MTELSFLLELLFNHKVPKSAQQAIRERIKEIESGHRPSAAHLVAQVVHRPQRVTNQSASTQRILDEMAAEGKPIGITSPIAQEMLDEPTQPAIIAQTPAAAAALNSRNDAIRIAISGKEEKGRTSPRKF